MGVAMLLKETKEVQESSDSLLDNNDKFIPMKHSLPPKMSAVLFGSIIPCEERCAVYGKCADSGGSICRIKKEYLDSVCDVMDYALQDRDALSMMKASYLLMPLFSQLLALNLEMQRGELLFGGRVNPVYKELRSVVRDIIFVLTDLGCKREFKTYGGGYLDGDSNYYDNLLKSVS